MPSPVWWALSTYVPALALLAVWTVVQQATGFGVVVSSDERLRILGTVVEDDAPLRAWVWVTAQAGLSGLLWFVGAAACLVAAAVLQHQGRGRTELAWFEITLAGITAWLGVDDVFMVHDVLAPKVLAVPEWSVVLGDLLLIAAVTVGFRRTVRRLDPPLLGLAVALLATSLVLDVVGGPLVDHRYRLFLAEALGFLGIVGWSGHLVRQAWAVVVGELRARPADGLAGWQARLLPTQPITLGRAAVRPSVPDAGNLEDAEGPDGRAPVTSLAEALRRDAEESGVPAPVAVALGVLPFVGGVLIAATYPRWPLFLWILREDHAVEWAQFALCVVASAVGVMAGVRFARRGQWLAAAAFLVLAVGMLALAGEEISWAQRALAFTTPGPLEALNAQEEFNVHNLTTAGLDVSHLFRLTELTLAFGGVALSMLTRLPPWPLRRPLFLAVSPPLFLVPAFAFAGAYRTVRFALEAVGVSSDAAVAYTEWAELVLYLGIAALAVVSYVTAGPSSAAGRPARPGGDRPRVPWTAYRGVLVVVVGVTLVTVVLAVLTLQSGVLPGNVS